MVADAFGNSILDPFTLGARMTDQGHLSHVFSRSLDGTCFATATLHTLRATNLADLRGTREWFYLQLKLVSSAFVFATLGESRRNDLFTR
jgi:hypothetical protein